VRGGQRADRAEIATIQGKQGVGAVLGGWRDVDRVSQVEVQGGVIGLNRPSRLQQVDRDVREEEPIASCLEQDEVDDRRPGLAAKPSGGQLVHLGEYQRRHDDRPWQWTCHGPREPLTELASDACAEVCEQQVHDDLFFDGHQVIKHRVQQVRVPRSSCLSGRR
jgi:hypothetical protein